MKKLLVVLSMVALAGCYNDNEEELYPVPSTGGGGNTDTISFAGKVQPILNERCAIPGCHDATGLAGGVNLSTYTGAKQAAPRLEAVISGTNPTMPKGQPKLPQNEIDVIVSWVKQGALNN